MLIKFQKVIFKYLKNMKTCAPTGATVIRWKCYWVQLVLGATVIHPWDTFDLILRNLDDGVRKEDKDSKTEKSDLQFVAKNIKIALKIVYALDRIKCLERRSKQIIFTFWFGFMSVQISYFSSQEYFIQVCLKEINVCCISYFVRKK